MLYLLLLLLPRLSRRNNFVATLLGFVILTTGLVLHLISPIMLCLYFLGGTGLYIAKRFPGGFHGES